MTAMRSPVAGAAARNCVSRPAAPLTTQPMRAPPRISLMQVLQARQCRAGSPRRELRHPFRLRHRGAAQRDEVGLAGLDGGGSDGGIAEPSHRDDGDRHLALDAGGIVDPWRIGQRHRRQLHRRGRQRAVMPGGDVKRIGACFRRPPRDLSPLAVGHALGEIILHRQAVDDGHARHRRFDRAQDVEAEASAIFQAAAILVGAAVLEGRVELRDEIAVRGMQLHAIESRRPRPRRGRGEGGDGLGDARRGHRLRHDRLVGDLIDWVRDRRGRDRRLAADVRAWYGRRHGPAGSRPWRRRHGSPR